MTVKPLRRDAAENRERVLSAASQVFAQYGLEGGVDEVARIAGVGMGTLYRRFPSKQALIDELVGGIRRELLEIARHALTATDGAGLEELLLETGRNQAAQPGCLRQLWDHSEAGLDAVVEFRQHVAELLATAQRHGRVRPELTSADISILLWSLSAVIERMAPVSPDAWRRHLEILVAGLRPADRAQYSGALRERPLTAAQLQLMTGGSTVIGSSTMTGGSTGLRAPDGH